MHRVDQSGPVALVVTRKVVVSFARRGTSYHLQKFIGKYYSTQVRRLTVVKVMVLHFLEQLYKL